MVCISDSGAGIFLELWIQKSTVRQSTMQYHLESPWLETASNSNIIGAVRNHLSKEQHKHQPASKEDVWMSFKEPE